MQEGWPEPAPQEHGTLAGRTPASLPREAVGSAWRGEGRRAGSGIGSGNDYLRPSACNI